MNAKRGSASTTNPETKRLMLAITAALLCQFALTWLASIAFSSSTGTIGGAWGSINTSDCIIVLLSMSLGGWIGGLRFLPYALLIAALIWIFSLLALAYTGQPVRKASFSQNFAHGLRFNGLAIVVSLLITALGAWLGALISKRRPLRLPS